MAFPGNHSGTYFHSPFPPAPIPHKDLLSFLFDDMPSTHRLLPNLFVDPLDTSRSLTAEQVLTLVRQLSKGLRLSGVSKGDCILIHAFNDIYYSPLALGVIAAGGIFSAANPGCMAEELVHSIKASGAKFIFVAPELADVARKTAKQNGIAVETNMWVLNWRGEDVPKGFKSWNDLLSYGETIWEAWDNKGKSQETVCARLFSSGTTGLPKAAEITHYNVIAQHISTFENKYTSLGWTPRALLYMPQGHVAMWTLSITSVIRGGWTAFVLRFPEGRFSLPILLQMIQDHKITFTVFIPMIINALVSNSQIASHYDLSSLKLVLSGAAPLSPSSQLSFGHKILCKPGQKVLQSYGLTETTCVCITEQWNDPYPPASTGSIGVLTPNTEAKLLSLDGNESEISEYGIPGELCIRGPSVFAGYYGEDEKGLDKGGWLKTGDVAYCEEKTQRWFIVGRAKETIKVRGFQVSALELENILTMHPVIAEACVIGVQVGEGPEEAPMAWVVLKTGFVQNSRETLEKDIKEFVARKVSRYKRLNGGVRFLDPTKGEALPRNGAGKVLKRVVRSWVEDEKRNSRNPRSKL